MKTISASVQSIHPLDVVEAFAEANGMTVEVYENCVWTGGLTLRVAIKVEKDGKAMASGSFKHNAHPARFNSSSRPRRGGARYEVYSNLLEQLTQKSVAAAA